MILSHTHADQSDAKSSDPKAGADVGKIVNLMSVDANKVCNMDLS